MGAAEGGWWLYVCAEVHRSRKSLAFARYIRWSFAPPVYVPLRCRECGGMSEEQRKGGRRMPVDGEVGVRYGGRNYLIYPGQRLVAQDGPWHLVTVPAWNEGGWINFKLYLNQKAKKNLWHLGVKDGQPAKCREKKLLEEHHPGRIDWVVQQAELMASGKIRMKAERGRAIIYSAGKGWRINKEQD